MIDIKENFYHLVIHGAKIDILDYLRPACYADFKGSKPFLFSVRKGKTIIIDLCQELSDIMSGIRSNFRNEIRRAEREGIVFSDQRKADWFVCYYNAFAEKKGLKTITEHHVNKYPIYYITTAEYEGKVLTAHVSYVDLDLKTVSLLFSASPRLDETIDTKLIGFSNKFLHYKDFEFFKDKGFWHYDFSGFSDNPDDKERLGIGQFKRSFGGEIVDTHSYYSPLFKLASVINNIIQ